MLPLGELLDGLARPQAYPHAVDSVEVRQTHISAVFLAGELVYKVKKPVHFPFLDFRTLEQRRACCEEEVRLNRRLAPQVYLAVVPVVQTPSGLQVEAPGEPVEYAVKMRRLPESATLLAMTCRDEVTPAHLQELAQLLVDFHRRADRKPDRLHFGAFDAVAQNARENFEQTASFVNDTVAAPVYQRLRHLTEARLASLRPVFEARSARGCICETHGDLHLDHVYHFSPDWVIIDCIEFSERFRYADPIAEIAFLTMDLALQGRRDLASAFAQAYFTCAGDDHGRELLPFYSAYRAIVRAKVEGFKSREAEVAPDARQRAHARARAHWLLALGLLEAPDRKPLLLVVGGLPGTGKSTLAQALAERADFHLLRSDVVRKETAGAAQDLYSPEWTEATYRTLAERAEGALAQGQRVLLDANFREQGQRSQMFALARRLGVPAGFLVCEVAPEVAQARLRARRGDVSDADADVYRALAAQWQAITPDPAVAMLHLNTDAQPDALAAAAARWLSDQGLATCPN